ncbi:FMN-binding negative transcriptional regulator [Thalassomonas viridans]|uniref:FMN-binding negative transcriptional regulator n=1 Tax=Thalassomonas viridans TaxID=137584 RepID=A0AAF0C963_9GAMM|nr:FMN-binding negative transcriptional regulator [Thalassomonas viridans]WDE05131.1 FMN-binding negative transcriptional regulator [Thalassomonas viridans]
MLNKKLNKQMPAKLLKVHQLTLVKNNPFARLVAPSTQGALPETTLLPLLLDEERQCLYGHLARNNPVLPLMSPGSRVLALFDGGHQYVSPRWHPEQKVPTWNYACVQLTCTPVIIEAAEEKLALVNDMSRFFDPTWPLEEILAPQFAGCLQQMLNAICVFRLDILAGAGRFKLGQRKSPDYHTTIAGFMQQQGKEQLALWQGQPPQEY